MELYGQSYNLLMGVFKMKKEILEDIGTILIAIGMFIIGIVVGMQVCGA